MTLTYNRTITLLSGALLALAGLTASAQTSSPLVGETATRISEHVWAVMGFPNIAIVVGTRATLIVDTGLGPRNGASVVRTATKLSGNKKLYLTTTHFHPEHAAGDAAFPPETILIRNRAQQKEMEARGLEMVALFSGRSQQNKDLLADVKLRDPDVIYDNETTVDLGGARVRLLWFGAAHTNGDELVFVEPDATLISGDVVQNKTVPAIPAGAGSSASWLTVLDKIAMLPVQHVLPDHSAPGDASLIGLERAFISDLRTRALSLKREGVPVDDAGKQLGTEFQKKYSDWPSMNVAGFVRTVYSE